MQLISDSLPSPFGAAPSGATDPPGLAPGLHLSHSTRLFSSTLRCGTRSVQAAKRNPLPPPSSPAAAACLLRGGDASWRGRAAPVLERCACRAVWTQVTGWLRMAPALAARAGSPRWARTTWRTSWPGGHGSPVPAGAASPASPSRGSWQHRWRRRSPSGPPTCCRTTRRRAALSRCQRPAPPSRCWAGACCWRVMRIAPAWRS